MSALQKRCQWILKTYVEQSVFSALTTDDLMKIDSFTKNDLNNQETIKEISNIYQRISKNQLNKTTMITASFCRYRDDTHYCFYPCFYDFPPLSLETCRLKGALYTGDFKIGNSKVARKIFMHYIDSYMRILSMSIPHHGSENYLKVLPFPFILAVFNQAGNNNQYGLPSHKLKERIKTWGIQFQVWM